VSGGLRSRLKRVVGERGVHLVQRLGRFRLLLKARRVREEGVRLRDRPFVVTRFVLLDPETHSYTYRLGNVDELVAFAARVLDSDPGRVRAHLAEVEADPELGSRLRRRTLLRLDAKWRMPLGNRLLWYLLVRGARPSLTVETGIFDGLGSLVLLRGLERNAREGHEGRLLSIDIDPKAGWVVPDRLRDCWERVVGDIRTDLAPAIGEREVGLLTHDSVHSEELQRLEFELALRRAADPLYLVDQSGLELPTLRDLCARRGGEHHYFLERPQGHFYRPSGTGVAVFRGARRAE
jgi:hypothetical protein